MRRATFVLALSGLALLSVGAARAQNQVLLDNITPNAGILLSPNAGRFIGTDPNAPETTLPPRPTTVEGIGAARITLTDLTGLYGAAALQNVQVSFSLFLPEGDATVRNDLFGGFYQIPGGGPIPNNTPLSSLSPVGAPFRFDLAPLTDPNTGLGFDPSRTGQISAMINSMAGETLPVLDEGSYLLVLSGDADLNPNPDGDELHVGFWTVGRQSQLVAGSNNDLLGPGVTASIGQGLYNNALALGSDGQTLTDIRANSGAAAGREQFYGVRILAAPVPEPSGVLAFGGAAVVAGALLRRRRAR